MNAESGRPAAGMALLAAALAFAAEGRAEGPFRRGADPSAPGSAEAMGPVIDGLRHGPWRIVHPDGSVEEGRYAHGLLDGDWVLRDPSGAVAACETWRLGRAAGPGTGGCGEAGPSSGEDR